METSTELDLSWVTPHIAVGGRIPIESASELSRLSIHHVVDLRLEDSDDEALLRKHGVALLYLPTPDGRAIPSSMIEQGVGWVRPRVKAGKKVLVHCEYGIGRSPLLTCCVLISIGFAPIEALTRVKDARAQASPTPEQLGALVEWASQWREANAPAWSVPSVDELGRIAYRHLALY